MSNSKQTSKSVAGGSSPTWLEHPTAAESEAESMSRNLFSFRAQPARVMPPLQLPAQQVMYAPQPMSGIGGSYMSLQMPQSVVRTTRSSPAMSAGNLRAHQPAGLSGNKRKCRTNKVCDLIDALSQLMPYPPKEDAASTLSDVIDYITVTQKEIQQLEEKLAGQQSLLRSRLIAGMQYQGTAAQGYNIPGSPIGSGQMLNQMVGTHVVPAIAFPVNQAAAAAGKQADDAAAGKQADDAAAGGKQAAGKQAAAAAGKQAAAAGKQADDDASAGKQADDDAAAAGKQAVDAAVGKPAADVGKQAVDADAAAAVGKQAVGNEVDDAAAAAAGKQAV